jgi:hypothetical protein
MTRKLSSRAAFAVLLVFLVSCASVGTGDPVVVRAEDALTNSLTVYTRVMVFHFGDPTAVPPIIGHSTTESVATYHAIEAFRKGFPIAWNAVDKGKRDYQANKAAGTAPLDAAVAALTELVSTVAGLIGGQ